MDFLLILVSFLEGFWGPNSIPKATQNLIDFWIDFLLIFGRFGGPSWGHVGDIFGQKGATGIKACGFVVAIAFPAGSGWSGAGFWTDFGAPGTDFGPILDRCWTILG